MRKSILLSLLLLSSWSRTATAQSDSEFNIKALAKDMEKRFEACPRREVVGKFDRKHHKQVWEKQAWGPPTDVFADVKPNDDPLSIHPHRRILVEPDIRTRAAEQGRCRERFGPFSA